MESLFDIRNPDFYQNGNDFAGSCRCFRFMIQLRDGQYHVYIWKEDVCFEKAAVESSATFENTADGFHQLKDWLMVKYNELL